MRQGINRFAVAIGFAVGMFFAAFALLGFPNGTQTKAADDGGAARKPDAKPAAGENPPTNVAEARGRARLLHETIHGALQVVHRDFFREDEKLTIPAKSFEEVFEELARSHHVQVRWLAVDTEAMNVDHKPESDFEKQAVKVLRSGKTEFESIVDGSYRHVGTIRLSAHCLKCHLPSRSSNKDRAAGLVITMPLKKQSP